VILLFGGALCLHLARLAWNPRARAPCCSVLLAIEISEARECLV